MSDREKLNQALENSMLEAKRPGTFEAILLENRIHSLVRATAESKSGAHEMFLDVCHSGLLALKDYEGNLAESPAAPILLEYLRLAFTRYVRDSSSTTTADRRECLASAFGITGKPGRKITDEQRMKIGSAFSSAMHEATGGVRKPTSKDTTNAARAAYRAHFGREWKRDDNTSAKGMAEIIRPILREEGYLPKKVGQE